MIWFFLGGMVAGCVGTFMLAGWWARKRGLDGQDVHKKTDNAGDSKG